MHPRQGTQGSMRAPRDESGRAVGPGWYTSRASTRTTRREHGGHRAHRHEAAASQSGRCPRSRATSARYMSRAGKQCRARCGLHVHTSETRASMSVTHVRSGCGRRGLRDECCGVGWAGGDTVVGLRGRPRESPTTARREDQPDMTWRCPCCYSEYTVLTNPRRTPARCAAVCPVCLFLGPPDLMMPPHNNMQDQTRNDRRPSLSTCGHRSRPKSHSRWYSQQIRTRSNSIHNL